MIHRRLLLAAAALLVLAVHGWATWQTARNRAEARGGTLLLTEREASLQPTAFESSVTMLNLNWRTADTNEPRYRPPPWLDAKKLAQLGFDCSLPLNDPKASRHYSSLPARRVYFALQCPPDMDTKSARKDSGLWVVDAALDPAELRRHYPDSGKTAIARGLVRLTFRQHDQDGKLLSSPRLEGWVGAVLPDQLSVPAPLNRLLTHLQSTTSGDDDRAPKPPNPPRFMARVHWGKNYEPWIDEVSLLGEDK